MGHVQKKAHVQKNAHVQRYTWCWDAHDVHEDATNRMWKRYEEAIEKQLDKNFAEGEERSGEFKYETNSETQYHVKFTGLGFDYGVHMQFQSKHLDKKREVRKYPIQYKWDLEEEYLPMPCSVGDAQHQIDERFASNPKGRFQFETNCSFEINFAKKEWKYILDRDLLKVRKAKLKSWMQAGGEDVSVFINELFEEEVSKWRKVNVTKIDDESQNDCAKMLRKDVRKWKMIPESVWTALFCTFVIIFIVFVIAVPIYVYKCYFKNTETATEKLMRLHADPQPNNAELTV